MNEWQPIGTAPKKSTRNAVRILLANAGEKDSIHVGYWDAYYAEGGAGHDGGDGWVIDAAGEEYRLHHDGPTHWMPLPAAPSPAQPEVEK